MNPIAGIGGRVGLKGSDGELSRRAKEFGGVSLAPHRTIETLQEIAYANTDFTIVTYPSEMGESEAVQCGFHPTTLGHIGEETTAEDTKRAVRELINHGSELILFAGGDGTAVDIMGIVGDRFPVLGIPAGVKMHSGVFAINPKLAGQLCVNFLKGQTSTQKMEVLDYDMEGNLKLLGYMLMPYDRDFVQGSKSYVLSEEGDEQAIAEEISESILDEYAYIIGPGLTAKAVLQKLGLQYTLLGVDVIRNKRLLIQDANERQLLDVAARFPTKILVGIVGGQGFLLGRGNQQISPDLVRKLGKDSLIVVATERKILSLRGRSLLVDTGDRELDQTLIGYIRVITGYRRSAVCRVGRSP